MHDPSATLTYPATFLSLQPASRLFDSIHTKSDHGKRAISRRQTEAHEALSGEREVEARDQET